MCQIWISGVVGEVVIRAPVVRWNFWAVVWVYLTIETRCTWPMPAKACLTFPDWVGGAFRRVRFALACRTEPLFAMIILLHGLYKRLREHFHGALFWVLR